MASSPSEVAGVFDRAADTYDAVGVPWFQPIAAGLVQELTVRPGSRVLDVGCGRGAALLPLARATGPTGTVLGIDLSPRMVALTAADVRDLPNVRVEVADAAVPGLPAASFDVVGASLVLFFLPDPLAALRQWAGLLVAGGRLGVSTFGGRDPGWTEIDSVFEPYLPPSMLDARTSGQRGPFASDDGVESLFAGAGLTAIRTTSRTIRAEFDSVEHLLRFSWSHGQRAMWEAVPAARRDGVQSQLLSIAGRQADSSGRLRLDQTVRYTVGSAP